MLYSTRRLLLGITAAAALSLALAAPASAITIIAGDTTDELNLDAGCSFREAVEATNMNATFGACVHDGGTGADTIQLNTASNHIMGIAGAGEDDNATGDFDIDAGTGGLTIQTPGGGMFLNGNAIDRLLHIQAGAVTITNGVSITGGSVTGAGGGILTQGNASLSLTGGSSVTQNIATTGGGGIQVSSTGPTTINSSTVNLNNVTASTLGGGGIGVSATGGAANLTITNSIIANNTVTASGATALGGGLLYNPNAASNLNVDDTLIDDNTVTATTGSAVGGGAHLNPPDGGTASFDEVVIRNNDADGNGAAGFAEAGGIRFNNGGGTITDSVIRQNLGTVDVAGVPNNGGGIIVGQDTVRIERSLLRNNGLINGTQSGGGIVNDGTLVLLNSTLSANTALAGNGGGLENNTGASTTAVNTTFFGNSATTGNAINLDGGAVTIRGSAIDDQAVGGNACAGTITSANFNVGSDTSCSLTQPMDEQGALMDLQLLADNDGPQAGPSIALQVVQSHRPDGGSTIRDQIPAASCTDDAAATLTVDQRNFPRPFDGNFDGVDDCDAGAFEVVACQGTDATIIGTPGDDTLATTGTAAIDIIVGQGGDDTITGLGSDDKLCGNAGNDILRGGDTSDADYYAGGTGADDEADFSAIGTGVNADLSAGNTSGAGGDIFALGTVENLRGGAGDDTFIGDGASNDLRGGAGGDTFDPGAGDDLVDGQTHGANVDGVNFSSAAPITASLQAGTASGQGSDMLLNLENLRGGTAADNLTGDAGPNLIEGNNGFDTMTGLGGMDAFQGETDGSAIFARDGVQDNVDCGGGASDTAQVDQMGVDLVDPSCETVDFFVPPVVTPPATTPPAATPTTPTTRKCPKGKKLKKGKCVKKKKKK